MTDYDKVFLKLKRFKDLNLSFEQKFDATRDLNLNFDRWSEQRRRDYSAYKKILRMEQEMAATD